MKAKLEKPRTKSGKPSPWGLFKAINGLFKLADMSGIGWVLIPRGLSHKNILRKVTMEESILNINLANSPTSRDCNRENSTYRGGFDHWTVCFAVVDAGLLVKTLGNKPCFKALN